MVRTRVPFGMAIRIAIHMHMCALTGPSPQDAALRGVMQALVRIQAYMLADRRCIPR